MTHILLHSLEHTLTDGLKLLPFLFAAYLFMEALEHKAGERTVAAIQRTGRFGPILGSALGLIPQCGFSAATANLYAGGVITRGTLLAILLSTSDEMLPILISNRAEASLILTLLACKFLIGLVCGVGLDLIVRKHTPIHIHDLCEEEDCGCEDGILKPAIRHTLHIFVFILLISFLLHVAVEFIGEETLSDFILNRRGLGEILTAAIGLVPNCASSVVITQLYLEGGMSAGALLAGLLANGGVGILVLFRANRNPKDNLFILACLYGCAVAFGFLAGLLPIF